jgi:hypothetical protein
MPQFTKPNYWSSKDYIFKEMMGRRTPIIKVIFLEVCDFLAEHDPVVGKTMGKDAANNAMMGSPQF